MVRKIRFTLLCNDQERKQINELSVILERSQGDAVRWAVRQVHKQLIDQHNSETQKSDK